MAKKTLLPITILLLGGGIFFLGRTHRIQDLTHPIPQPSEIVSLRNQTSKTFQNPDGTFTLEAYAAPIHYQDKDGSWEKINTSFASSSDPEYAYEVTQSDLKVYFKKDLTSEYYLKYQHHAGVVHQGIQKRQPGLGVINTQSSPIIKNNTLTYPSIFEGVDLKYTLTETQLLEEYLVHTRDAAQKISTLTQRLRLENTHYEPQKDGSIQFYDGSSGEPALIFPAPVMYEWGNPKLPITPASLSVLAESNQAIHYELNCQDGSADSCSFLTTTKVLEPPGKEWLLDPTRSYPVVVDDTVTFYGEGIDGKLRTRSTICGRGTPTKFNSEPEYLYVGTDQVGSSKFVFRSFISFDTSGLAGKTIQSATLRVQVALTPFVTAGVYGGGECWSPPIDQGDWTACSTLVGVLPATNIGKWAEAALSSLSTAINPTGDSRFRLVSATEQCTAGWQTVRYYSGQSTAYKPELVITYQDVPTPTPTPTPIPVPGAFNKTAPMVGVFISPTSVAFRWSSASKATGYALRVYDNNNKQDFFAKKSVGNTNQHTLNNLPPLHQFLWQVWAQNSRGETAANNGTWWWFITSNVIGPTPTPIPSLTPTPSPSLTPTPTSCPLPSTPSGFLYSASCLASGNTTAVVSWSKQSGVIYQIQFATNANFINVVKDSSSDPGMITCDPGGLNPRCTATWAGPPGSGGPNQDSYYYFRARGSDLCGSSGWGLP